MLQITYTLVETVEQAQTLARTLVQEKLAACVNIIPNVQSVYGWQGELTESSEVSLIIKSSHELKSSLIARLKALHPYEIPAIASFEASSTPEYEAWVATNMRCHPAGTCWD